MCVTNFDQSLSFVLKSEGGYSDDAKDPGGSTMNGVTQSEYSSYLAQKGLPDADVRDMQPIERDDIYKKNYWNAMECDTLSSGVDYCVFDAAVNSGPGRARKWLNRSGSPTSIDSFCDQRLSFLESLSTWQYFGKGWASRVSFVRINAKAMASGGPIHDTTWVQSSLNKLGEFLDVDGIDGSETLIAIKKFQAANNLDVDGQAGPITCAAIDSVLSKLSNG